MSSITVVSAGDDIEATWGASVANYLNSPATRTTATGAITTTQTQVVSMAIAANTTTAGDMYHVHACGVCTSTASAVVTFRIRMGTTTLTGNIAVDNTPTANNTASGDSFCVDGYAVVRTIGSSGTALGSLVVTGGASQPFGSNVRPNTNTSSVTFDTTATKLIELTAVTASANTSVNFHLAYIRKIRP